MSIHSHNYQSIAPPLPTHRPLTPLSICPSVHASVCSSVHPFLRPSICPYFHSSFASTGTCAHLPNHPHHPTPQICLFVCLTTHGAYVCPFNQPPTPPAIPIRPSGPPPPLPALVQAPIQLSTLLQPCCYARSVLQACRRLDVSIRTCSGTQPMQNIGNALLKIFKFQVYSPQVVKHVYRQPASDSLTKCTTLSCKTASP